ncbi:AAA family ATPase [Arabiibacter massiliensis]|uniref:AAA family ATPase n=1 Tax=Arabiibacter massiliensis TaxID=1870985 RepID=UPI0009B9390F|nr:AAA family ATPase [Arabiibacter massiliensis]
MDARSAIGTFFEGVIRCPDASPDLEGVAATVNFLRANDVMIDIGKPRLKDGAACLPFIVKEPESRLVLKESGTKRSVLMIKELFEGCDVSYRAAAPSVRTAPLLKACTRLASMKPDGEFAEAADFAPPPASGAADGDPFDGLVGMEAQKRSVREVADAVSRHGRRVLSSCHMAFIGNPGTGKTELARRLLAYCDRTGVTSGAGVFVQADAANLIGRYVGETPRLVREKVLQADGGILFIDEAYRLAEDGRGGNAYAYEAVNALVELLESRRERFVCVLAGYPADMERLFAMNAGLRERIGFRIPFPDYGTDELAAIFASFARANGFALAGGAQEAVREACRALRGLPGFANARSVRRLFERAVIKQVRDGDGRAAIEAGDVRAALADPDLCGADGPRANPVGFSS